MVNEIIIVLECNYIYICVNCAEDYISNDLNSFVMRKRLHYLCKIIICMVYISQFIYYNL